MRILFIAHRIPYPPNKGEKLRALWELRKLAENHCVDLFCFYDDPEDARHARELSQYCERICLEKLSFLGSRARALVALVSGKPFSSAFFHSPRMARRIDRAVRSGYYDRIVVYSSSMAHYVRNAGNVPKLLDMVDVDSEKWLQYANCSTWPWSWLWRHEAQCLGAYEATLVREHAVTTVCTAAEAITLRSNAPAGRIAVLENHLDVNEYKSPRIPPPEFIRRLQPYLVFSGSMDYRPNIDAMLYFCRDVLPLIQRSVPAVRLVIAGRNPHPSIRALKNHPAIHITGKVPDIKPYIRGAAVAVVPIRLGRGVQNKILEALACGTPTVSSEVAAAPLPDRLRSLLSVANTPQEMSHAIVQLLRQGDGMPKTQLCEALQAYMSDVDLPGQLERLIRDAGATLQTFEGAETKLMLGSEVGNFGPMGRIKRKSQLSEVAVSPPGYRLE